jgi:hypothetical protein
MTSLNAERQPLFARVAANAAIRRIDLGLSVVSLIARLVGLPRFALLETCLSAVSLNARLVHAAMLQVLTQTPKPDLRSY